MEIITERNVSISIKGQNEQNINASMSAAFDYVLKQLSVGRHYGSKSRGKTKVVWGVEEKAKHV